MVKNIRLGLSKNMRRPRGTAFNFALGATALQIVDEDFSRRSMAITNIGAIDATISCDLSTIASGSGIILVPKQTIFMDSVVDMFCVIPWYGIAGAACNVRVEMVRRQ